MAWLLKDHEANRISACFHLITFLLTCTALAQPWWFKLQGSECTPHLSLTQFFSFARFGVQDITQTNRNHFMKSDQMFSGPVTISYLYTATESLACVSPRLSNLMRIIILLCFMILLFSMIGVFLNLIKLKNETLQIIQKNGLLSVFCVIWVLAIVGVSYYVTQLIDEETNRGGAIKIVEVSYDFGFYTITTVGIFAILGATANLLSSTSCYDRGNLRDQLVDDWDGLESLSNGRLAQTSRSIVIANANSFVPAAPRRTRNLPTRNIGNPRRNLFESRSVDDDLAMLTPPPPYTP